MKDALSYWKQKLQHAAIRLELPTDHPRSAAQGCRQAEQPVNFSPGLLKTIQGLSRAENVPFAEFLLTAFSILLYRYSGQEEIVIGWPAGRMGSIPPNDPFDGFLHTSLLRIDFAQQPGFREMLDRVHRVVVSTNHAQEILLNCPIEELSQPFSAGDASLPGALYVFRNKAGSHPPSPGMIAAYAGMGSQACAVDLVLTIDETEETIQGLLEYSTARFEPATISRMAHHFENILAAAAAEPERPIATLPILSPAEQRQVLIEFNDSRAEYPGNSTIVELFEAQVEKTQGAAALIYEDETLTYRQLNERANQLAYYLRELGVGPETCVGLCMDRSIDMVTSIFGILKAGGAYVPLDPDYPEERLKFLLEDTAAPVLITKRPLIQKIQPDSVKGVILLDDIPPAFAGKEKTNPVPVSGPVSLAYVIYTSGSTGQPKGVCCIHRSVINLLADFENRQPVSPGAVCSWWTSIGFDVSVYEIFSALLYGRALFIVPQRIRADSRQLFENLRRYNVKSAYITPSQLRDLADWLETAGQPAAGNAGGGQLRLERLLVGVEPINELLLARIARAMPGVKVINGYGPTEATVCSTLFDIDPSNPQDRYTPIGRPVQNTQIYLLDAHCQPVPLGVPGEIYIGGDGLARGYLNRPELTAKKFIPNPFSDQPGARLYRTGDIARYLPDGSIVFTGRVDEQVKIRGYRIELGEIEAALRQQPAVKEALALAQEYAPGDKRLVAYIVMKDGGQAAPADLRGFLRKKLPTYMVPSAFVIIDELPLNPNGKVDRKKLPVPGFDRSASDPQYAAPRNPTEEILADIWARIFKLEAVGIYDNFFDLGGDSILSIQITSKTNEAGVYLTPNQIFDHPTIAQLASIAESAPNMQAEQGLVSGELPLTPIQHWFFEQNFAEPHHWNQAFLLKAQQALDHALLEKAVQQLLVHHDVLRLRFVREESGWRQVMNPVVEAVSVLQVDLSSVPEADQKAALQSAAAQMQSSLNLTAGPLMRVALINLGSQKPAYILIVIHHLAVDGVSWRILLDHLNTLYQQLRYQQTLQLPPKTTSFKQWSQRLAEYAQSEALERELPFWLAQKGSPDAGLPVDYPKGKRKNIEESARTVSLSLSMEATDQLLREAPKAYQTQINDILLTALAQVVAEWIGNSTVLINLEGHGREAIFNDVDLLRTAGWFTTIFPVLLSLEGTNGPGERLKSIKEQLRRIPGRGIGYGLLRYLHQDVETTNVLQALPEAEISFNYLGQFDQILTSSSLIKLTNESCGPKRSLKNNRHHLLEITGMIIDGQLRLDWTYSENIHRRATIENLANRYITALSALIAHCQSPAAGGYTPSDFPEANLSQQELDDLLKEIRELENED